MPAEVMRELPGARPVQPDDAEIRLFGPGYTAQMTYYETRAGAKVFAAGAFTLAGSAWDPQVSILLDNVWARLSVA